MKALVLSACIGICIGTLVAFYRAVRKQPPQPVPLTTFGRFVDHYGNDPRIILPHGEPNDFGDVANDLESRN